MPLLKSGVTNSNPSEHDHLIEIPRSEKEMIRDFYHKTISKFAGPSIQQMQEEVRFIVVGHLVPTLPFYLEALSKIGIVAAVVKKGSVPDANIYTWLKKWLPLQTKGVGVIVDHEYVESKKQAFFDDVKKILTNKEEVKRLRLPIDQTGNVEWNKIGVRELLAVSGATLVQEWVKDKKGILIDIGGYFAHSLKVLQEPWKAGGRVIGIVEDTENGHQLYDNALWDLTRREIERIPSIITVARSQIKDSEDYNVGKAITDAVDHILRTADYTHLAESKVILVIGYGKIGSAAARVAAEKTRGPVLVCEIDPVRRLKASAHSFAVVDIEKGLSQADVIICCTGKKCLTHEHLKMIKNNAYIASCTSREQEFHDTFLLSLNKTESQDIEESQGLELLKEDTTQPKERRGTISRYTIAGKTINLLNDGNSVNFVEKAVHGYFIHGVLASLATAAIRLYLEPPLKPDIDKPLKKGVLNDFNDLVTSEGLHYQSVIAEILMREKLRKEPLLTNYRRSSARYLPKDGVVQQLNEGLMRTGRVHLIGGKKYGKSQIVEEFFALHGSRYDIVWRFDASSSLDMQFRELASTINNNSEAVKQTGMVELSRTPIEGYRSPWGSKTPPAELEQSRATRQKILKTLEEADLSYVLIYEDIDILKEKGELTKDELRTIIPNPSYRKREHIIVTSSDKTNFSSLYTPIKLTPFPTLKLFKFLINNDALWNEENSIALGRLAYSFVHPTALNTQYQGEEIAHQDEGYDVFVAMSNLFSSFMKKNPTYDWRNFICNEVSPAGHIAYFLKLVLQELTIPAQRLLFLFYTLDLGEVGCALDSKALAKFSEKVLQSTEALGELIEHGLIEESTGFLRSLLPSFSTPNTDPLRKVIRTAADGDAQYEEHCKKFIMSMTIKQFCNYHQVLLLPMVERIAQLFMQPEGDGNTSFYINWKEENEQLYRKLFKRLGDFHWINGNKRIATLYYEVVEKEYRELRDSLGELIRLSPLPYPQHISQSQSAVPNLKYLIAQKECQGMYEDVGKKLAKIEARMKMDYSTYRTKLEAPYPMPEISSTLHNQSMVEDETLEDTDVEESSDQASVSSPSFSSIARVRRSASLSTISDPSPSRPVLERNGNNDKKRSALRNDGPRKAAKLLLTSTPGSSGKNMEGGL